MPETQSEKPIIICIANASSIGTLRQSLASQPVKIGTVKTEYDKAAPDKFFQTLERQLSKHAQSIDTLIFSQAFISRQAHDRLILIKELSNLISQNLQQAIHIIVIDENNDINVKGKQLLTSKGIEILPDIAACTESIADRHNLSLPKPKQLTDKNILFGDYDIDDEPPADPFADLRDNDGDDGSSNSTEAPDYIDDDYENYSDDEDADDAFSAFNNTDQEDTDDDYDDYDVSDGIDSSQQQNELAYYDGYQQDGNYQQDTGYSQSQDLVVPDESTRYGGFSGEGTMEDIQKLIPPTYGEPQWDYSELNEEIRESKKPFGRKSSKNNKSAIRMQYANSLYINQCIQKNNGYDDPQECKVITCYSNVGGSGKTTVSTMIAAQLVWDFDKELLEHHTSNMSHRILVMSLNEFDDTLVKGIGSDPKIPVTADSNEGHDILALKRKIEETGGEPTWDDISYCFRVNPANYVMYLPSMSLAEKFKTRQEINDEDYKKILTVCKRFFNFIIIDTPDELYDRAYGVVPMSLGESDVVCLIMTPDVKSILHMTNMLTGMKEGNENHKLPFSREQTMLVLNKVVTGNNPYAGYTDTLPQNRVKPEAIANAYTKIFFKTVMIPFTDQFMDENIMFGYDRKVKEAASNIVDTILEMIDRHDHRNGF